MLYMFLFFVYNLLDSNKFKRFEELSDFMKFFTDVAAAIFFICLVFVLIIVIQRIVLQNNNYCEVKTFLLE